MARDGADHLMTLVPHGLVAEKAWLLDRGVSRHKLDNQVKRGRLVPAVRGVLSRPDARLTWQGVVCSLQRMGYRLWPGGLTALRLHGLAHYAALGDAKRVDLYGPDPLPMWTRRVLSGVRFTRRRGLVLATEDRWTVELPLGPEERPMSIATPERAWFEVLLDVPNRVSFEHADQLMQGLGNLSPSRLNGLLEECTSVKVRRLFLWFAERHGHGWRRRLDTERFTMDSGRLGSGKRQLAADGTLEPHYLITVPRSMAEGAHG